MAEFDRRCAAGGPVSPGKAYLVGEQGPEIFAPKMPGAIIPNGKGGGGGVNVNFAPVYNVQGSGPEIAALRAQMAQDRAEFPSRVTAAVRDGRARRML